MRVTIVSGQSGSGKTVALHTLEDEGFYCIDNLPAALLPALVEQTSQNPGEFPGIAVCIDRYFSGIGARVQWIENQSRDALWSLNVEKMGHNNQLGPPTHGWRAVPNYSASSPGSSVSGTSGSGSV